MTLIPVGTMRVLEVTTRAEETMPGLEETMPVLEGMMQVAVTTQELPATSTATETMGVRETMVVISHSSN